MEKIVSLCKRRGFVFPGSDIYGGLANSWDYGPLGVELKNNIKQLWWKTFVHDRDDMVGIDAAIIMNPKVWEASGHVATFNDPLVEDKKTNERFRLDHLLEENGVNVAGMTFEQMAAKLYDLGLKSPKGNELSTPKKFNLMFETYIGPVNPLYDAWDAMKGRILPNENWDEDRARNLMAGLDKGRVYLRPETAQAMFVNFKNVIQSTRSQIPFGIAQIGKAFRNEITPGNFIFRQREFEQMEIEYFVHPSRASEAFEYWLMRQKEWVKTIGLDEANVRYIEIPDSDRAHYSSRSVDTEYIFPFGQKELYGLANRTDFDLKSHIEHSGQSLDYVDPQTNEKYVPYCIEPTWGVDRTVLAVLCAAYKEEGEGDEKRVYLALAPKLAPYTVAVFPLMKNKPELVEKAQGIYRELKKNFTVAWDDRGNVGKRYYAQDEIGTPWCVTVDFETLEDNTVTIRNRDTMQQERIVISELGKYIQERLV